MLLQKPEVVKKPRKDKGKTQLRWTRGTPYSLNQRILDHLYRDLRAQRITAMLLIEISRDMREALIER